MRMMAVMLALVFCSTTAMAQNKLRTAPAAQAGNASEAEGRARETETAIDSGENAGVPGHR